MSEQRDRFRIYILNDKGHIQGDALIVSTDDAQAIEAAKKIVVGARNVAGGIDASLRHGG
jgi:hypothetical protein